MLNTIESLINYTKNKKGDNPLNLEINVYKDSPDYLNSFLFKNKDLKDRLDIYSVSYTSFIDGSSLYKVKLNNKKSPEDTFTYLAYINEDKMYEYFIKECDKYTDEYLDGIKINFGRKMSYKSVLFIEKNKIVKQLDKYLYNKRLYMEKLKINPNIFYFLYDNKKLVEGGSLEAKRSLKGHKIEEGVKVPLSILKEQIKMHNESESKKYGGD